MFNVGCVSKALEIVDACMVVEIVCKDSGRSFFKVKGTQQQVYHVLFPGVFCPCIAFAQNLNKSDGFLVGFRQCKHLLAVNIARAMRKVYRIVIPDECFYIFFSLNSENPDKALNP